ncbi:MAG: 23S rRNA (adenine(2503)-C(2))-methyltransferase RlmN [Planctomycetota bacterium]|nr:23S rRNA (adenine(2503)-C(2))-methyltransferase RlmN [Planctomycetota bacterium]
MTGIEGAGGIGEARGACRPPDATRPPGAARPPGELEPSRPVTAVGEDVLEAFFERMGEPRYRARQVMDWVYAKAARSYAEMSNLPAALRDRLARELPLYSLKPAARAGGPSDEAEKFLFETGDGDSVEAVMIRQPGRNTACLSSQVGCPIGCAFCATGLSGFARNLREWEIVEQLVHILGLTRQKIHNVVYMGMGEPLLNYDAVMASVRKINAPIPRGLGIGARHITISTVGIVPAIERLAGEDIQVELAISLHAPDDGTRAALVPAASRYKVPEIVDAARRYFRRTGRQVTFEYVLLKDVNDSPHHARRLASLLSGFDAKVNLIPYNPVDGAPFERPGKETVERFRSILLATGVPVTVRLSKGGTIRAACGQLRRASSAAGTAAGTAAAGRAPGDERIADAECRPEAESGDPSGGRYAPGNGNRPELTGGSGRTDVPGRTTATGCPDGTGAASGPGERKRRHEKERRGASPDGTGGKSGRGSRPWHAKGWSQNDPDRPGRDPAPGRRRHGRREDAARESPGAEG